MIIKIEKQKNSSDIHLNEIECIESEQKSYYYDNNNKFIVYARDLLKIIEFSNFITLYCLENDLEKGLNKIRNHG